MKTEAFRGGTEKSFLNIGVSELSGPRQSSNHMSVSPLAVVFVYPACDGGLSLMMSAIVWIVRALIFLDAIRHTVLCSIDAAVRFEFSDAFLRRMQSYASGQSQACRLHSPREVIGFAGVWVHDSTTHELQ